MFGLISKQKIINIIKDRLLATMVLQDEMKKEYSSHERTEWSYYKNFWILKGAMNSLKEFLDALE